jgi:magnesium-transporting ATPase (P-type)
MSAKIKNTSDFKRLSIEETFKILETSMLGLTESEAKNRIEKFGYNEIAEEKKNPLVEFFSRYWGPMPWLLELAIVLSCVLESPDKSITAKFVINNDAREILYDIFSVEHDVHLKEEKIRDVEK